MGTVIQLVYRSFNVLIIVCCFGPKLVNAVDGGQLDVKASISGTEFTITSDENGQDHINVKVAVVLDIALPKTDQNGFKMVFKGFAGIGQKLYPTLMDESSNKLTDACVTTRKCHYKHAIVNRWKDSSITEVKFVLYNKEGEEKVVLTFTNNPSDDKTSWFSAKNLLTSYPWKDLTTAFSGQFFSVAGYTAEGVERRFYILSYSLSCYNDLGWMVISDINRDIEKICKWESQPVPTIVYSTGNPTGFASYGDMKEADSMAIFVKTPLRL